MKRLNTCAALLAAAFMTGCSTTHLIFTEEDHIGLKAQFEPNNPSPAELTLGYRRGIVTVIPQQSPSPSHLTDPITVKTDRTNTNGVVVTVIEDPDELMSVYTRFKANIGFLDPVEIHHFLATGTAAASLLANEDDLRAVTQNLKGTPSQKEETK